MASVNKKFAVEKGLEVGENALVVDADNIKTGIGKTDPIYGLDVATTANFDGVVAASQVGIGSTQPGKDVDFNKDVIVRKKLFDSLSSSGTDGTVLTSTGVGITWASEADIETNANGLPTQVQYKKANNKFGGASNFVYDPTNNRVGIGSTQPEYMLQTQGGQVSFDSQILDVNNSVGAGDSVLSSNSDGKPVWIRQGAKTTNIIYVTEDGNDLYDGLTLGSSKRTIEAACNQAVAGNVIRVAGGIYTEDNPVFVPRNVTIDGDDLRNTQIIPSNVGQDLFQVNNGCLLQNLSFVGAANTGAMITFPPQGVVSRHRFVSATGNPIVKTTWNSGVSTTPTGVDYDPTSGITTFTTENAHGISAPSSHSLTTAAYNPATGIVTCTLANHNFGAKDLVAFKIGALVLKCNQDSYATEHPYPRATDVAGISSTRWLGLSNITTNTFEVNVGSSSNTSLHKTQSIAANGLERTTAFVGITTNGLTFTCDQDRHTSQKTYPRPTDPLAGIQTAVIGATANTFVINSYNAGSGTRIGAGITQSPYLRNCTNFVPNSTGMRINGDHAEGVKSMVVDSYTQYNQGGIGVSISNDGYAQLVSIFTVCDESAITCVSGGQCDLNNSNASFGTFGLISAGIGTVHQTGAVAKEGIAEDNIIEVSGLTQRPYTGQVLYLGTLYNNVESIVVTNPGSGYTSDNPPTVSIANPSGPGGISAEGVAVISGFGSVTSVNIFASGSQYTSAPAVTIAAPASGITATATAALEPSYYTINSTTPVTAGVSTITLDQNLPSVVGVGATVPFAKQSLILASSYTFEYVGAGLTIGLALPNKGGITIPENETVSQNGGKVVYTSTDERGNLKVGDGFTINQQTGTVTGDAFNKSIQATLTPLIIALGAQ